MLFDDFFAKNMIAQIPKFSKENILQGTKYLSKKAVISFDLIDLQTINTFINLGFFSKIKIIYDLSNPVHPFTCSCPSRQLPCAHSYAAIIAMLFIAMVKRSAHCMEINDLIPKKMRSGSYCLETENDQDFTFLFSHDENDKNKLLRIKEPWWLQILCAESKNERFKILRKTLKKLPYLQEFNYAIDHDISQLSEMENPCNIITDAPNRFMSTPMQKIDNPVFTEEYYRYIGSEEFRDLSIKFLSSVNEKKFWKLFTSGHLVKKSFTWKIGVKLVVYKSPTVKRLGYHFWVSNSRTIEEYKPLSYLYQFAKDGNRLSNLSAEDGYFLTWLANNTSNAPEKDYRSIEHPESEHVISLFNLYNWISEWTFTDSIIWTDGNKVDFNLKNGRITIKPLDADKGELMFILPAGGDDGKERMVQLSSAEWFINSCSPFESLKCQTSVFVKDGNGFIRINTGTLTHEEFITLSSMQFIPLGKIRNTNAAHALISKFGHGLLQQLEDTASVINYVKVKPTVELRCSPNNALRMTVYSDTDDKKRFLFAHGRNWELQTEAIAKPEAINDEALEMFTNQESEIMDISVMETSDKEQSSIFMALVSIPDQKYVAELEQWLGNFIPKNAIAETDAEKRPVFSWIIRTEEVLTLQKIWSERPGNVTWLGNRKFRELLFIRKIPKLKLSIEGSGIDWFNVSIDIKDEMESISIAELDAALEKSSETDTLIVLPGARVYKKDEVVEYKKVMDSLCELGLDKDLSVQKVHPLQFLSPDMKSLINIDAVNPEFRAFAENLKNKLRSFSGIPEVKLNESLTNTLRPYQNSGVNFLVWSCRNFGGAILADDMGLGKTLQVLASLTALIPSKKKDKKPSLIICPASVSHNWQREIEKFTPHFKCIILQSGKDRFAEYERLKDYDIIIMNYSIARNDEEILKDKNWLLVCIDEAQMIKNPVTGIARVVKSISADYKIALTGTPIENKLLDLWSIVDFTNPGYIYNYKHFEEKSRAADQKPFYRIIKSKLRPILLRRLKSEVAPELPPRIEERRDCAMTDEQRKAYLKELKVARDMIENVSKDKVAGKDRIQILAELMKLREICCEPQLVGYKGFGSGKVNTMLEIIEELYESGHKVLLFSQFVKMLEIIEKIFIDKKIPYSMLTGKTKNRKEIVEGFENDPNPSVFLLSLKAGGLGLNLTSATHVILFDPWWNPAVEAQAIDRTHRIGQDKTVIAYRLVTEETIEEKIIDLQEQKKQIVKDILEEDSFNRTLSKDDFKFLFKE